MMPIAVPAARGTEWRPRATSPDIRGGRTPPGEHWWTPIAAVAAFGLVMAILVLGIVRLGELTVEAVRWLVGI